MKKLILALAACTIGLPALANGNVSCSGGVCFHGKDAELNAQDHRVVSGELDGSTLVMHSQDYAPGKDGDLAKRSFEIDLGALDQSGDVENLEIKTHQNMTNISNNSTAITNNSTRIETNSTEIQVNRQAIADNSRRIADVDQKASEALSLGSMAVALAGLHHDFRFDNSLAGAIGLDGFGGVSGAIGYQRAVGAQTAVGIGLVTDGTDWAGNVHVTYGW